MSLTVKKQRRTEDERKVTRRRRNRHSPHRKQCGLTLLLGRGKNKDAGCMEGGGAEEVRGEEKIDEEFRDRDRGEVKGGPACYLGTTKGKLQEESDKLGLQPMSKCEVLFSHVQNKISHPDK